jgi:CDP-glucose 4,6-dehydratase
MPGSKQVAPFWQDRPVLVTGATGFLGSWLVTRLATLGADVVCVVRDWVPQSELVAGGVLGATKVVCGDVRDQALAERVLGEYEIRTVFHLAAQTTVGVANRNPISTLDSNIRGTWSVLDACRRVSTVEQVLVASSDKAYGAHDTLPYTEAAPLVGRHPYDVSKSCADLIAQMYAHTYHLPVCVTRCGNFYGGGDLNWNRIVPGTIRSIVRGERPIIRSDGQFVRDYLYVEDGVGAYLRLAEAMADRRDLAGEAFNFSSELQITVADLVQRILTVMGSTLEPDVRNEASNEIRRQYLDATKARRMLGWSPAFTLDAGLEASVAWYRRFFERTGGAVPEGARV